MCMSWTGFSVWLRSAALCDETEWYSLAGLQITAVVMSGLLQSRSLFSWLTHDPVHREEASRPHLASLLASSTMATSWWELFKQHCRKSNIHGALVPASHNPRPCGIVPPPATPAPVSMTAATEANALQFPNI